MKKRINIHAVNKLVTCIIGVFIIFLSVGCDIQKQALKNKTNTEQKNDVAKEVVTITEETAKGGTVKTEIIPETNREKDEKGFYKELIQKLTNGGATQTIYYKPDGSVAIDCTADEIWKRIETRLKETDKTATSTNAVEKQKEKTENFDSIIILYILLGFIAIVGIIAFFGFKFLNKNTQVLTAVLKNMPNQ